MAGTLLPWFRGVRMSSKAKRRFHRSSDPEALSWLRRNIPRLEGLFSSRLALDFVFEPFKAVFKVKGTPTEREVRATIAGVSLANAVIAGLPGKLGVGLFVAVALEIFMAYRIARHLGYSLQSLEDARDSLGAAAAGAFAVFFLFKEVLGGFFSLFNTVGALPATVLAEYTTTTFIGVVLWLGFEAGKKRGRFVVPVRLLKRAIEITRDIVKQHAQVVQSAARPATVRLVWERFSAFVSGEVAVDRPALRGDVFVPVAMAYLLMKEGERLDGPLGQIFLDSIRQAWPDLADAGVSEIADHMRQYGSEELQGVMNLIQGQVFERMVELAENGDGDAWTADLHDDRTVEGSDMVMSNTETGGQVEVSLKATMNESYIEQSLLDYPDIPIYATDEVARALEYTGAVHATGISHAELVDVTDENFDELLWQLPSQEDIIAGGLTASAFVRLYPFLVAYARGRIGRKQLETAVFRVTGQTARATVSRLLFAAALGPVFGWYLLARGAITVSDAAHAVPEVRPRVVYRPRPRSSAPTM